MRAAPVRSRLRVRPATMADAERIAELRLALLGEHSSNAIYSRLRRDAPSRAIELTRDQLAREHEAMFVATKGQRVVGVLRCIDQRGHRLLRPARFALISTVYVEPAVRRQGVLRSLMEAAVGWSRERGLTEMRLQNAIDNPLALAAWDALGFRVVEQIRLRPI
ncbi:MAG TPA: GNAT family N-acetyltransferase [Gemmatimonadaceae bacterium]|nr:GNAT family N-acetyltransferase [Gemmatimonadaceae bacterium]